MLLNSKELDVMIYYHKKFLAQVQKDRLQRLTDEDRLQKVAQHFKGEPLLVTNVDLEKKTREDTQQDPAPAAADREENGQSKAQQRSQSMQAMRPRRPKPAAGAAAAQEGVAKWQKKKRVQKFLLDFRRVRGDGQVLSQAEQQRSLERAYEQQPVPNRATYFKPTLKIRRNPQLRLIETYFVAAVVTRRTAGWTSSGTCR